MAPLAIRLRPDERPLLGACVLGSNGLLGDQPAHALSGRADMAPIRGAELVSRSRVLGAVEGADARIGDAHVIDD